MVHSKGTVLDSQTSLKFINIPRGSFRSILASKDYKFITRYSNFSQILKLYERFRLGLIIFPFKRRSISLNCACARIIQNYTKAGGGHSSRNDKKKAGRVQRDSFRVKIKTRTFCKIHPPRYNSH